MTEQEKEKCRWKSKYDLTYKCGEPIAVDGHCSLHDASDDKDPEAFKKEVEKRIKTGDEKIDLRGCYFPRGFEVKFIGEIFEKPVDFSEATFTKGANFVRATFTEGANFVGATFTEAADFTKTLFQGQKTNFREAKFEGDAIFSDTQFKCEEVSFSNTYFIGEGAVDFDNPHFDCQVYFIETKFEKCCKFRWAEFPRTHKQAVFEKTDLGNCSFLYSSIDQVDFRHCKFGEEKEYLLCFFPVHRQNVIFDERNAKTKLDFEMATRVYRDLEKNFDKKGDRRTASEFYYGEMECKRKQLGWKDICFSLYNFLHTLSRQVTGYGVRLGRSLFFIFVLLVVSCGFYKYEGLCWSQAVTNSLFGINVLLATIYNCVDELSDYGRWFFWFQTVAGTFLTAAFVLTLQRVFTPFK